MKKKILQILLIGFFSLNGFMAFSQSHTFTNNNGTGDGLWSTASNWADGTRPPLPWNSTTTVIINANCTTIGTPILEISFSGTLVVNAGKSLTTSILQPNAAGRLNNYGSITTTAVYNYGTINIGGVDNTSLIPATLTVSNYLEYANSTLNLNPYGTIDFLANFSALPTSNFNWNNGGNIIIEPSNNWTLGTNTTIQTNSKLVSKSAVTINSGVTLTNQGEFQISNVTNNGTIVNNGLISSYNVASLSNFGTLTGNGTQGTGLTNNGIFSPAGAATGCYTFTGGNINYASGTTNLDILGTTPCNNTNGYDQIVNAGVVNVGGVLNLNFGSYIPPAGTTFQLFQITGGATTYTGSFSSINVTPNTIPVSYNRFSGVLTIVDLCPPPTNLYYGVAEVDRDSLSWSAAAGATGYEVQYKKQSVATWTSVTTPNTGIVLTNLEGRTTYDVRVRTVCSPSVSSATWATTGFITAHGTRQNGPWQDANTWWSGEIPANNYTSTYVRHAVTVNSATAICGRLYVQNGSLTIPTGNTLTVGDIDLVNQTGGDGIARFTSSTLNMTGGSLNIGGQLYFETGGNFNMSTGNININGQGAGGLQGFGFSINTSSLYMDNDVATDIQGGTISIFPPTFQNNNLIIEANKDFGNFNTCMGATVILETDGRYRVGGLNATTAIGYVPRFYNLILKGITTRMNGITVKNNLTVDGGNLEIFDASTFGTVTPTNSGTITGTTPITTGVCTIPTFTSVQAGDWTNPDTWSLNRIPTATDDVTVLHTVTHQANTTVTGYCRDLTIGSTGTLNQQNTLNISGNLTIDANGTFVNNPTGATSPNVATNIGFTPPNYVAGTSLVTVNGLLSLQGSGAGDGTGFNLAGRMVFNLGSSLALGDFGNFGCRLWGWSGGSPQYLMDIGQLSTLSLGAGFVGLSGNAMSNTLPAISPNRDFNVNSCNVNAYEGLNLFGSPTNPDFYFGDASTPTSYRQNIAKIIATNMPTVHLDNVVVDNFKTGYRSSTLSATTILSNNSSVRTLDFRNGGVLSGDLKLVNNCNTTSPNVYVAENFTMGVGATLTLNTTDSAIINIAESLPSQPITSNLTVESGRVIVKGSVLDLTTATLSGFNSSRYFVTNKNYEGGMYDGFDYGTGIGSIRRTTANGSTQIFDIGVKGGPSTVYTPLSIRSNSGTNPTATVSASVFEAPATYLAPTVSWTIATTSTNATITFYWDSQLMSSEFLTNINNAKVYRLDGATWTELPSSTYNFFDNTYAMTATNVTTFGTFAIMVSALPRASVISATTNPPYCQGGSVTLSGNVGGVWSTGATTPSITVTTTGNYSVTNTNAAGSVTSNILNITFNALPNCTITGTPTVCTGQTTQLCAPTATNYLWNTGATTSCITVSAALTYGVTVTDANSCQSICSQVVTSYCPPIMSDQTGEWQTGSTWKGGVVPTANDDVIIDHAVTNGGATSVTSNCKNLTINGTGRLNQDNKLVIGGNVTIQASGIFSHGNSGAFSPSPLTEIGANININAPTAGTRLITVNGILTVGGNNTSFALGGRIVFGPGSTFNLKANLLLHGWSGSPEYLMDIDNLTTFTHDFNGRITLVGNALSNTKPVISPNRDFDFTCDNSPFTFWNGVNLYSTSTSNNTYYLGSSLSANRQMINRVSVSGALTTSNVYLNNVFTRLVASSANIYSTNTQYSTINATNTTLYGDYVLMNSTCEIPTLTANGSSLVSSIFSPTPSSLTINATDSAVVSLANTFSLSGNMTVQNGKIVLKGSVFDLSNITTLTGLNSSRYFVTKRGTAAYSALGSLRLTTFNNVTKTFDVGMNIAPSTSANFYTPLSITTTSGSTTATVSAETFTPPSGRLAPNVQWTIASASAAPTMNITFNWPSGLESTGFAAARSSAKVYRYNGSAWIELPLLTTVSPTVDGFSITANGVTTLGTFAVMVPPTPQTIISAKSGPWNQTTTWERGIVPTEIDDAIIDHTVTNSGGTAYCNNLTINANKQLDQRATLIIGGNLTVNGTFNHGDVVVGGTPTTASTQIGAANASAAAGMHLVTVAGTLTLGNNLFGGGFFLAGRMVFSNNSTLELQTNMNLTLTGWSGVTPQYLMDIDGITTLNANLNVAFSTLGINVTHGNGTQPVISTGRNFVGTTCNFSTSPMGFNLSNNETYYFGGATRRSIKPIYVGSNANLYLTNTTMQRLTAQNGGSVHSTGGQFSNITAGGGTTLFGDYTIIDDCNAAFPIALSNSGNLSFDNTFSLNVNASNSVDLNIPVGVTQNFFGTINMQSGKVIVKGGTLDLRSPLAIVNGLDATRYFATAVGTAPYNALGAVLLPAVGTSPVTFKLGLSIPNGANPPTNVYAPVNITSTNGNTDVTVSLQTLTAPTGFVAPNVQWNITPSANLSPTLTITLTWPPSAESSAFSLLRNMAKIYHWNGTIWEQLSTSSLVTNPDGSFSLTAAGVVNFSPFAVMAPSAPLGAELLQFSAKANGNKTTLNWQTANETNVKNFDIEKSIDGANFSKIKEVKANNTPSVYQAFDDQFFASTYYRLKTNDLDGKTDYFKTVFVAYGKGQKLQVFPNPVKEKLTILGASKDEFKITDLFGRVIQRGILSDNQTEIDVSKLPSGLYLLQTKNAVEKFLKD
jgi:Secretion system C-terminal sorting domain